MKHESSVAKSDGVVTGVGLEIRSVRQCEQLGLKS